MKYVALLSGGKDSCFNLLHCQLNGHELIAAASLSAGDGKEEIDSYLYQTVGQDAIDLVAQALEVPLFRASIKGAAVDQRSDYGSREVGSAGVKGDETEDLFALLSKVKEIHPDVQGVSVGAILSNYQRVRVEHVCLRLSLTPLSYLWQRNQDELLSEMIESDVEAVIIKIAGIGLTTKHLGMSIAQMQPTLRRLNDLYGAHICGEGGEYETLTLDCPLFKRKMTLRDVETVIHSDSEFAPVAYMRIRGANLEDKNCRDGRAVCAPDLLSEEFDALQHTMSAVTPEDISDILDRQDSSRHDRDILASSRRTDSWVVVANVQSRRGPSTESSIEDEVTECFQAMQNELQSHSVSFSDIAFITVLISDMAHFAKVNQVYRSYFGSSPPSRACVAVDLPPGINVRLDCLAYDEGGRGNRKALHVQGLSYWAPANIGPYSQAVSIDDRIFVSGQIGMIPKDLSLPSPSSFATEFALSFQHASRILSLFKDMFGSAWNPATQCIVCWLTNIKYMQQVRQLRTENPTTSIPSLFVGAKALPKGALVETQVFAHTGQYTIIDSASGEEEMHTSATPLFHSSKLTSGSCILHWELKTFKEFEAFHSVIVVKGYDDSITKQFTEKIDDPILGGIISARLFTLGGSIENAYAFCAAVLKDDVLRTVIPVPVRFISTLSQDKWDFALCIQSGHK